MEGVGCFESRLVKSVRGDHEDARNVCIVSVCVRTNACVWRWKKCEKGGCVCY